MWSRDVVSTMEDVGEVVLLEETRQDVREGRKLVKWKGAMEGQARDGPHLLTALHLRHIAFAQKYCEPDQVNQGGIR